MSDYEESDESGEEELMTAIQGGLVEGTVPGTKGK